MSRFQGRGEDPKRMKKACPKCGYEYLRAAYIQDQRGKQRKSVWQKIGLYCERCHHFVKQSHFDDLVQKHDKLVAENEKLFSDIKTNIDELNALDK